MKQTYRQEFGPTPTSFKEYSRSAAAEYTALLSQSPTEATLQMFLERNPSFVPGSGPPGGGTGHPPLHDFLVSQPVLPGLSSRRPDFMWIATDSDTWYPTLIEIEAPQKRLFRGDRQPTAEFTQARNQLVEWKSWFEAPENRLKFESDYGVRRSYEFRRMQPVYILIMGRRAEFDGSEALTGARAQLMGANEVLMSFDRLAPAPYLEDVVTVGPITNGVWKAKAVAPTFGIIPQSADRLAFISGLEEAIATRSGITAERADFLRRRIAYWSKWATTQSGLRSYSQWERE